MSDQYCPQCKSSLGRSANFCFYCGTRLVKMDLKCECGIELSYIDKFCPKCGKRAPLLDQALVVNKKEKEVNYFGEIKT